MKKKINRVGKLIVEYIRKGTIDSKEVFEIFEPYIQFKKNHGDPNPTRAISLNQIENAGDYNNLLGQFSFKIKPSFAKSKNIRNFRINDNVMYGVWLYDHLDDENNYKYSNIYFSTGFIRRVYQELSIYHFLREMRKLVPDCLIKIEMLMFKRL